MRNPLSGIGLYIVFSFSVKGRTGWITSFMFCFLPSAIAVDETRRRSSKARDPSFHIAEYIEAYKSFPDAFSGILISYPCFVHCRTDFNDLVKVRDIPFTVLKFTIFPFLFSLKRTETTPCPLYWKENWSVPRSGIAKGRLSS